MLQSGGTMASAAGKVCRRMVLALAAVVAVFTSSLVAQQAETGPPDVGQGSLLFRSPVSGKYFSVPLLHTDARIDVRGLAASVTVIQQYANSSAQPIEAVYVFPLPHDAAVYDMEIHICNRVIHSVVRERQEAKK